MIFIFGFGHRITKDYGPALPVKCPNCGNQTYWRYKHHRTWATLFFIPIIPYENEYALECEICRQGITLNKEEAARAKVLSGYTDQFMHQRMTQSEYDARVKEANLY